MDWDAELLKSARIGDLEKAKECLTNGANVNAKDNGDTTIEIKEFLIKASAKNEHKNVPEIDIGDEISHFRG